MAKSKSAKVNPAGVAGTGGRLRVERREASFVLTLENPAKKNAMDQAMREGLGEALAEIAQDDSVRAVGIRGAGGDFCAGADLKGVPERTLADRLAGLEDHPIHLLAALRKPTVAAIEGVCLGGGLELALACDIRIASETARLGLPEVKLGALPGAGGTQRMVRAVGEAWAKYLILTGQAVGAEQAQKMGLVHEVSGAASLEKRFDELLETLAAGAPLAQAAAKSCVEAASGSPGGGLTAEAAAAQALSHTADRAEGIAAFGEKRPPRFRGK